MKKDGEFCFLSLMIFVSVWQGLNGFCGVCLFIIKGALDSQLDTKMFEGSAEDEEEEDELPTDVESPFYTWLAHFTLKFKYVIVIVIVAATIPG